MFSSALFVGFILFTHIACSPLSSSTWSESDLTKVTGQRLNPYRDIKQSSSSPESLHILNTSSLVKDDKGKQAERKKHELDALTTTPKRKRGRPITIKKEIIVKTAQEIEEERNARRKKNSELLKERWKDPKYRKTAINSIKRYWDDPERRLMESKRRKENWAPGGITRIKHEQRLKQQRELGLPMRKLSIETRQKISAKAKLRHAKAKQSNAAQNQ